MDPDQFQQIPPQSQPHDPRQLVPVVKALAGHAFPYLQQPTGPISFTPNAAGKVPVADPMASYGPYAMGAVDAAGMIGPEALAKGGALAALHLMPSWQIRAMKGVSDSPNALRSLARATGSWDVVTDEGKHVLDLRGNLSPESKDFNVEWVGSANPHADAAPDMNSIGFRDIRSLVNALAKEYPEAETLSGLRVSGARYGGDYKKIGGPENKATRASIKLPRPKEDQP